MGFLKGHNILRDLVLTLSSFISGFYIGYMMESNICDPIIDNNIGNTIELENERHSYYDEEVSSFPIVNTPIVKTHFFDNTYQWMYLRGNRITETSAYYIPQHKIIFCGIAKNSISMWKLLLLRLHDSNVPQWWLPTIAKIHDWNNGLQNYRLHHENFSTINKWMNDDNWYKVVFIRDPLERALSGVIDKGRYISDEKVAIGQKFWGLPFIQYLANTSFKNNMGKYITDQHVRPQHTFCDLYKYRDKYHIFSYHNKMHRKIFLDDNGLWEKYGASGWSPDDHPTMNKHGIKHNLTYFGNVFPRHNKKSTTLVIEKYNMYLAGYLLDYYRYDYVLFDLKIPDWICAVIDKDWPQMINLMEFEDTVYRKAQDYKRKVHPLEKLRDSVKLYQDFVALYTILDQFPTHLQPICINVITDCVKYGKCPMEFGHDRKIYEQNMRSQQVADLFHRPKRVNRQKTGNKLRI